MVKLFLWLRRKKGRCKMIKLERTSVFNFENAIRGMRNPLESWDKSDSKYIVCADKDSCTECPGSGHRDICYLMQNGGYLILGEKDLKLATSLAHNGSDHRKFLRQIMVSVDITAPLYWWAEADTYKVGTVRNSCSKMHKLLAKPFEISDFSFEQLPGYKNEIKQFVPELSEEDVAKEAWCYYDADYDVSNYGRVKHKLKNHYRLIGGSLHQDGYRFVTLHGKQIPLHRIVAKLWHPETYNETLVVNHLDGNKQNNTANNLEWVTQSENVKHSHENGLQPKTVTTYKGKFSTEEREKIKEMWDNGKHSKRELARMYGVSHTCICAIINDKYKYADKTNVFEEIARPLVDYLNELRDSYLITEDEVAKKKIWYTIIQLLPESYNQRSTVTLNYEVLLNQYHARNQHKLSEWLDYCDWIKSLPYFKEICL